MSTGGIGGGGSFSALYTYSNRIHQDIAVSAGGSNLYTVPAGKVAFITHHGRYNNGLDDIAIFMSKGTYYGCSGVLMTAGTNAGTADTRYADDLLDFSHAPLFFGDGAFLFSNPDLSTISSYIPTSLGSGSKAISKWIMAFQGAVLRGTGDDGAFIRLLVFEYDL